MLLRGPIPRVGWQQIAFTALLLIAILPRPAAAAVVVLDPPQSQTALPGEDVKFSVSIEGHPPISYQWRLNGNPLLGETNSDLKLFNVQAASGGAFSVTVADADDAITTGLAELRVEAATGPVPQDDFADRPTVYGSAGILQGNSRHALSEPGEPLMPGGGKTVWCQWIAPANGIATLSTRGSAFDTLLGVFTGSVVSNLTLVARDDDLGGFYTSELRFNAQGGVAYEIMLDGFDESGMGGEFTLSLSLLDTRETIPVFLLQPETTSVVAGSNALFRVVTSATDVGYQWYFNGLPIEGAFGPTHVIPQTTLAHVGRYHVRAHKNSGQFTDSAPADLQLASGNAASLDFNFLAVMQDKCQNLSSPAANGNRPSAGVVSIGLGYSYTKYASSSTNGQVCDPNPCGSGLFGTLWQAITATNNGIMQVDTIGSVIPTRLAVYRGAPGLPGTMLVACDVTSCTSGLPCVVKFNATAGTNYAVVVEGYHASGQIQCNCALGVGPPVPVPNTTCLIAPGASTQNDAPTNTWIPAPTVQWQLNGTNLPHATNASLIIPSFSAANAGFYHFVLSNFAAVVTNRSRTLLLQGPFLLGRSWTTNNGNVGFKIMASNASPFILQSSANVEAGWQSLATNMNPCGPLLYTNTGALLNARRFFRAIPWPPPP